MHRAFRKFFYCLCIGEMSQGNFVGCVHNMHDGNITRFSSEKSINEKCFNANEPVMLSLLNLYVQTSASPASFASASAASDSIRFSLREN
jgi:hypothetical protein